MNLLVERYELTTQNYLPKRDVLGVSIAVFKQFVICDVCLVAPGLLNWMEMEEEEYGQMYLSRNYWNFCGMLTHCKVDNQ